LFQSSHTTSTRVSNRFSDLINFSKFKRKIGSLELDDKWNIKEQEGNPKLNWDTSSFKKDKE